MIRGGWPGRSLKSSRGSEAMAMTGLVKDELSRVEVLKPCCRKAEVSTLLRFAGGLHIAGGRIVVEAELDTGAAARRLRKRPDRARTRRPAQGEQVRGTGAQGRRQPGPPDRPGGQPRAAGPRPAPARGV